MLFFADGLDAGNYEATLTVTQNGNSVSATLVFQVKEVDQLRAVSQGELTDP